MTPEQRFERIESNLERLGLQAGHTEANLDRLAQVVNTIAASVAAHDDQIEALIKVSERQAADTQALKEQVAALSRDWQAYLTTIHPKQ